MASTIIFMTEDTISRKHLLSEIDELMKSPWFNRYKDDIGVLRHGYIERKEAVEVVRDLCVKAEPSVISKPCEDCVSREFMYKLGAKCIAARNENGELVAITSIESLPPVTPKQRTGKWIKICPMVVDGGLAKRIKCSECGDERLDYFISKRYCPNCGAKMEGESE